jgi:hypothetical protein
MYLHCKFETYVTADERLMKLQWGLFKKTLRQKRITTVAWTVMADIYILLRH